MIYLWVCRLSQHKVIPNRWGPKIEQVLNPLGRGFLWTFTTTSARQAKAFAVGLAELDAEQAALADADPEVWVVELSGWREKKVSDMPQRLRQKMDTVLTDRSLDTRVTAADSLPDAVRKILAVMPGNNESMDSLISRWKERSGSDL